MPEYGYKISEMAGSERFFEAERLLDIKLAGFEKAAASFEADGSRRQEYSRTEEDGSEKKVTLIKNVTESGILVFSNIPLKFFRFGGKIFYLWDILPTVVMGIFWWVVFTKAIDRFCANFYQAAVFQVIAGFVWFLLVMLAGRVISFIERKDHRNLKILFVPYRSRLRINFIARGGAVSAVCIFLSSFMIFSGMNGSKLLNRFLHSPILALIVSVVPLLLFMKGRR